MPNVRFNLKSEPDPRLIILVFRFGGKKFQYSTGEKVPEKFWDKANCRVRANRQFPAHRSINDLLNMLQHVTENAYRAFMTDQEGKRPSWSVLVNNLKNVLDVATLKEIAGEDEKDFWGFVDQLIEERRANPEYKERTVTNYINCRNRLEEFEKQWGKKIDWHSIDLEFSISLRQWMYDQGKKTNTVHSLIKNLRVFLNEATERGINTNMAYRSRRFQIQKEKVDNIYLTVEELAELYRIETDHNYQARARDLFIIGAFTGLRYSDFTRIQPENIVDVDGEKMIRITTKKTGQRVEIPINPLVWGAMQRNGGKPPRAISNQKMNQYVKEVCRLASWGADSVLIDSNRGGVRYTLKKEKWEMVSTHTARRSFATNAYLAGVPVLAIMAITGHKTEKQFLNYIKIGAEEHARRVAGHEFFKKGLFRVG